MILQMLSYEEFLNLTEPEQKEKLESYRKDYKNKDIRKHWNINDAQLYKHINHLGLVKKIAKRKKSSTKKTNKDLPTLADLQKEKEQEPSEDFTPPFNSLAIKEILDGMQDQSIIKEDGFQFSFKGKYNTEEIVKKLEKLQLLLDDEENQFDVQLTVKELCK